MKEKNPDISNLDLHKKNPFPFQSCQVLFVKNKICFSHISLFVFAKNLYTICDEINKTTPYSWIHRSYIENIIRTEGHKITIENKYYAKKERCRERGLNFAQVINLWHCEHPHLLISLEESPYEWL